MADSLQHINLMHIMETWVRREFSHYRYFSVLTDRSFFPGGSDRPPKIKSCFPDLYATDVPETFCIVGEAKTSQDVKSERSQRQISIFVDYLLVRPTDDFFVLAIPYDATDNAVLTLRKKGRQSKMGNGSLKIFILNEIGSEEIKI